MKRGSEFQNRAPSFEAFVLRPNEILGPELENQDSLFKNGTF